MGRAFYVLLKLAAMVAFLCGLFCGWILPAMAGNQMIHQQGLDLIDGKGNKIKLRTVNLSAWLHLEGYLIGGGLLTSQTRIIESLEYLLGKAEASRLLLQLRQAYITKDDIQQIAADKFNCVRVPINCRLIDSDSAVGWSMLDRLSEWCAANGVYMIIDLHSAPGGQSSLPTADPDPPNIWQSKEKLEKTCLLWGKIADHFKDNSTVAGYDLLNEPVIDDSAKLIDTFKKIIKAVRAVDENHLVIVEGLGLKGDLTIYPRPLDHNMMYSFHMYDWFGDNRSKRLAVYGGLAHQQNVPMFVGEYGENTYENIDSTLKMFSSADYISGWAFWSWKRAVAKYPNLNIVEVPANWKMTMAWIANPFHQKPTKEQCLDGLTEMIQAVSIHNTTPDKKLAEIIQQY